MTIPEIYWKNRVIKDNENKSVRKTNILTWTCRVKKINLAQKKFMAKKNEHREGAEEQDISFFTVKPVKKEGLKKPYRSLNIPSPTKRFSY